MIKFTCPLCNEKMEIDDEMVGRKVPCIRCNELIGVPEPTREEPIAQRFKTEAKGLSTKEALHKNVRMTVILGSLDQN